MKENPVKINNKNIYNQKGKTKCAICVRCVEWKCNRFPFVENL